MIRALLLVMVLACMAVAGPPTEVDWLTTFEVAPGGTVAVWSLVDSFALWPSSFGRHSRMLYDTKHLEDVRYMFTEKGDYVRAVVYLEEEASWHLESDTRVVFSYLDRELWSAEILFIAADRSSMFSSRDGIVLGSERMARTLMRAKDGGYYSYLRFEPPGVLPRPARKLWLWGGNRWGVLPPLLAVLTEGGEGR